MRAMTMTMTIRFRIYWKKSTSYYSMHILLLYVQISTVGMHPEPTERPVVLSIRSSWFRVCHRVQADCFYLLRKEEPWEHTSRNLHKTWYTPVSVWVPRTMQEAIAEYSTVLGTEYFILYSVPHMGISNWAVEDSHPFLVRVQGS